MDTAAESQPLDLRAYASVLWRRKWIFLAVVVLVPVAVYFYSTSRAKVYEASTLMQVEPTAIDSLQGTPAATGPTPQFVAIAARLIQTSGVAQAAARQLSLSRRSAGALLGAVKVSTDPSTGFVTITADADSPGRAADVANAFGAAINSSRARQAISQLNQAIANLQAQLGALPPRAGGERRQLSAQVQRLRAQRAAQGTNVQVIEPAASGGLVSPRPVRDALLALIVAALLGLGIVAVVENIDRRIRRPEQFEEDSGLPVLSSLPSSAFDGDVGRPLIAERFRSLRANLSFFNIDRSIRSIVIASGRQGEGKTLVAIGLARAYTAAGNSVILVDADLRRPRIASRLGMPGGAGVAGVLVGKTTVSGALMDQVRDGKPTGLRVLPSGEIPPNPAELLGSERMHTLVQELSSMCDLVIIDTSPLHAVSDALPLLDRVSGILLVARVGLTQRHELHHLRRLVDSARSAALGIVATGVSERGTYGYEVSGYLQPVDQGASVNGDARKSSRLSTLLGRRRQ